MKDSIKVRLQGGLGNQLFGWAAGFALAQKLDFKLILDTSLLKNNQFALMDYNFQNYSLEQSEFNNFASSFSLNRFSKKNFYENSFKFDSEFEKINSPQVLNGYFQSWKYFERYYEQIRAQVISLSAPSLKHRLLSEKIENENYICVHVRRGDYLNLTQYHGLTTQEYYSNAIGKLLDEDPTRKLMVFSDSVDLAREVIKFNAEFIGVLDIYSSTETLDLMSRGNAFVGSNSSFSWWAAFLRDRKLKSIFFPRPWFANSLHDTADLLLPNWMTLGI